MFSPTSRTSRFNLAITGAGKVSKLELFRLGVLRDGVQLTTADIRFPVLGQVVPRIEIEVSDGDTRKKVTVRVNQLSSFMFDGTHLSASINGTVQRIGCVQFIDGDRAPTGMYNFGLLRENGMRSFVFDYHTFCAYKCDFCFKESEWEILAVQGASAAGYSDNFEACLQHVREHAEDFLTKYDIVWLCTGSIKDAQLELDRHCRLAAELRAVGYTEGIYVSQVIPNAIRHDGAARRDYLQALKDAGVSRFNSGVEIVNNDYRKRYVHGYKGTLTFDDYVTVFTDAVEIFGHQQVGSCLLAGIEPPDDTLRGLETISALGVVPSPTVLTPFVVGQQDIPFHYDLDGLIDVHVAFNEIIEKYRLPIFSGVFSLA
ncbi:radical SAM protein [Actinocorallia populi]|uniref:radical SAM protein n=1 Tax=Actinocorallia populi TaxID=2079200 RepID=UPI000D0913EF|nr:radical SAM protein [Actinocorallia populi]